MPPFVLTLSSLPRRGRRGLEAAGDDSFPGLPDGATHHELFALLERAGPALGMTDGDIAHLSYLLHYTKEDDWEAGAVGPVVYQSVEMMAVERGVSDRQINYREHKLHELGLIRWR